MSVGWVGGSTRAWRKVRQAILVRDGYRCQVKGKHCTHVANTVNHKVAKALGGTDSPDNLEAACGWCNSSLGAAPVDPPSSRRW